MFWGVMFGGLAHLGLAAMLSKSVVNPSELQLLISTAGSFQMMPVLLIVVAVLFAWAILALTVSDHDAFREVEAHSYAAAIFMMCACAILAFVNVGTVATTPTIIVAALVTSAAASRHLMLKSEDEPHADHGRELARRMALGAAHNSLLSRVSGRAIPGQTINFDNVTAFPKRPNNGDQS
jgi:hypothetical protein